MKKTLLSIAMLTTTLFSVVAQASTSVYENYPDPLLGSDYVLADAYSMSGSEISLLSEQLADKIVQSQIVRDGNLYVLAFDADNEPYFYLADLVNGTVTELDKVAVVPANNGRLKIADITLTADGVLVATSYSKNQYNAGYVETGEVRGSLNCYKWTKNEETGLPKTCELWFTTTNVNNFQRTLVGKSIAYSGTLAEGTLYVTSAHGTNTTKIAMRTGQLFIANGSCTNASGSKYINTFNDPLFYPDAVSDCNDYEIMLSPRSNDNLVYDANKISPFEWSLNGSGTNFIVGRNEAINPKSNGAGYFKYNGKSVMVAPNVNDEGLVEGILAYDVTEGFDKAIEIEIEGGRINGTKYKYASAHGEVNADDASINMYLVVDGKVNIFTASGVTVGLEELSNDNNAPVEYYNLQGVKISKAPSVEGAG